MVSLVQIDYILALMEEKNFQRAAEKCFVTQPTLSIQLKKAEQILGGKLFDRDVNPLQGTPFLDKIIPYLLQIKQDVEQLDKQIKSDKYVVKETIRIGIIPTVAHYLIPAIYGFLLDEFSEYEFILEEIKTNDLLESLQMRKLDLAILAEPFDVQQFQLQKLYVEEIFFYMKTPRKLNSINDLKEDKAWLLSEGNCLRTQLINFCELSKNTSNSWNYEGGSIDVLIKMVDLYGGYTAFPSNYSKKNIDADKLSQIKEVAPARSIVACFNKRNSKQAVFKKLFYFLQEKYKTNEPKGNWTLLI
jgi:LysR family hydrogen peroxide-inducible transcriptional activator